MRARAETLGGSLEAGPTPDGGFEVVAELPAAATEAATKEPAAPEPAAVSEAAAMEAAATEPAAAGTAPRPVPETA
jgi:hypothetical protein